MADNLTPEQRSYMMSRVRSTDTTPELIIRSLAHARGLRFRKHCGWLPGRPDLVFVRSRVVVFVDGDYWHGWRFPEWKEKLGSYWKQKIEKLSHGLENCMVALLKVRLSNWQYGWWHAGKSQSVNHPPQAPNKEVALTETAIRNGVASESS